VCQRVYIGTRRALTLVKRTEDEPFLAVKALETDYIGVRRYFGRKFDHFYVALAHLPCGCGFPAQPLETCLMTRPIPENDRKSLARLRDYLRLGLGTRETAQLYFCWVGDEETRPRNERTISLIELDDPEFRFRRSEILTVRP
jgi:hypothetical protein